MARLSFIVGLSLFASAAIAAESSTPPHEKQPPAGAPATAASESALAPDGAKLRYSSCHVDGPYVALTFDDGPHATNTPRLLDMLKERGIKATFFMVGECAAEYPQIVKRIVAEGHEVANHSWSHPQLSKMTDAAVEGQLRRTQDAIVNACGVTPKIMRPPYGAFTARQQRWCYGEFGYKTILWDVDPLDWKYRNAAHVESEILKQTHAGSIILSHDIHKSTVDAMPPTLDALLAKGYKFVTVSELIAMDKPMTKKVVEKEKVAEKTVPEGSKTETKPEVAPASVPPTVTPQASR